MCTFAGAKVSKFNRIALDEDVLGFDIPMEDAFLMDELNCFQQPVHECLDSSMTGVGVLHQKLI